MKLRYPTVPCKQGAHSVGTDSHNEAGPVHRDTEGDMYYLGGKLVFPPEESSN